MRDDLLIERLQEALRRWDERPASERFEDMVRRGVIDKDGNVLRSFPLPPRKRKKHKSSSD